MHQGMVFTTKHVMYRVHESVFVTYLYAGIFHVPGYVVYHQTRDLSGQSTPHMIRSRVTHHVIQSATLATFQVRSKCM